MIARADDVGTKIGTANRPARAKAVGNFVADFDAFASLASAQESEWVGALRRQGIARFENTGLPTVRDEDWKYTNLQPLGRIEFQPVSWTRAESRSRTEGGDLDWEALTSRLAGTRLLFVDGCFCPEHSSVGDLPSGVKVVSLRDSLASDPEVKRRLSTCAGVEKRSTVALNTAYMQDGVFVHVPRGVKVPEPIHTVFVATGGSSPTAQYPRNLIVAETDAHLTFVEEYVGLESGSALTNPVTEFFAAESATVDHYRIVCETAGSYHLGSVAAVQSHGSKFSSLSVCLGGGLVRNNVDVVLSAEEAECTLNGLVVARENEHVDNQTRIVHAQPNCRSWEVYKNILCDRATGVFNGKIYVAQDAQKTDAKQSNQSLLLSRSAVMNSKPELEIYADDVKCTHGATVGELDREAVFYLRSRGLSRASAEALLTYAFAADVLSTVTVEDLRGALEKRLFDRLPQGFSPTDSLNGSRNQQDDGA